VDGGLSGRFETPWGEGSVTVRHGCLVRVELPPVVVAPGESAQEADPADRRTLQEWVAALESYFRGERLAWTEHELSMDELGVGAFESRVYSTLLSVPPGVTVSYGALAEMAGYPRAARAVGNAMAANPVPIIIPCHRVIRSDGSLGNYGNDPALKERLLEHARRSVGQSRGEP